MNDENILKNTNSSLAFLAKKYEGLLAEVKEILKNPNFKSKDIGDAPISPMSLDDCTSNVFLSKEIMDEYQKILYKLVNPSTALEYAYLMVGIKEPDGNILIEYIFDIGKQDSINNRSVVYDNEKLNKIISVMSNAGCNFFSLCHTHPLVSEEEKQTTIASYLSEEIMTSEYIRDAGLNLSLQDVINENIFQEQIKKYYPHVISSSAVIMYNGEIAMFQVEDGKIKRYINIYDKTTGNLLKVSSKEEYKTALKK